MADTLKYDLEEIVTEAIMSKTPAVIVEGRDDVKFYQRLAAEIRKNVMVYAIENIEEYSEGCNSVIKCIENLQDKIKEREDNINYILGIIDRDARYFRNEIPSNLLGLFVLKYYSYESHFVTRNNLRNLIANVTNIDFNLIDDKALDFVEADLKIDYENLYFMALEALKKACTTGYKASISYRRSAGALIDVSCKTVILKDIEPKKKALESFAKGFKLTKKDIKLVAKGKWLLYVFSYSVLKKIRDLNDACTCGLIPKCQFCICGNSEKCLWKLDSNYQLGHIVTFLLNFIDDTEVIYIKDRMRQLA